MIKLKNLWKIALATMAMSAMLVACDTGSSDDKTENDGGSEVKKILATGGTGVYSYTANIKDVETIWGGSTKQPKFSVVLLTDKQLKVCTDAANLKQATAAEPEYQIGAYGNMTVASTETAGDYLVYGVNAVNDEYQYYDAVVATIDDSTITLTVDMTKLYMTDLKALWSPEQEQVVTNDDIVDLTGYKPYVIALGTQQADPDNYIFSAWSASVMAMEEGATLPANPAKNAPVVPKVSEMAYVCSNYGDVAITFSGDVATAEITYALANATWSQTELAGIEFGVCDNTGWGEKYTGAEIKELDKEVELIYNSGDNNKVAANVLEAGKTYVITINAKNKTVKVSAK